MDSSGTKFCTNCGKEIPVSVKFCPYCGHPQDNSKGTNTDNMQSSNNYQSNYQSAENSGGSAFSQPSTSSNIENTAQSKVDQLLNLKQNTEKEEAENARKEESLSLQERSYINDTVANNAPSTAVTYLLGIFLFEFGGPQWYLHHYVGGVMALICTFILSWIFGLGIFIEVIWFIVDLFLYPLFVRHARTKLKRHAINEVLMMRR